MGHRAEVALYRIYIVDSRHRYVRIVRRGRSWAPKTQPPGQPGAYYLRYRKNGRRTFESVGGDLSVALQEREAREKTLVGSTETVVPSPPSRKTLREHVSLFAAKKDGLTKTERRRANTWRSFLADFSQWWGREYIDEFRREHFDAFRKHLAATAKKPRTQRNLLSDLLTFLRGTGRLVRVVWTEDELKIQTAYLAQLGFQDALVIVKSDFPRVVKNRRPSYYADEILKALFDAAESWEVLFLALFLYSGMREDEVAHLYWNNVLWQGNEIEVKDKPEWGFHPKTYETRNIKIHAYLLGVLNEHYALRKDNGLIFPNAINNPEGHFLDSLQRIAYRAGVVCGVCHNCTHGRKRCKVKGRYCQAFGLHKFRRTYATIRSRLGVPVQNICSELGHKDIATTQTYLGVVDEKMLGIDFPAPLQSGLRVVT
jgi:integrase/recombinase XerD